MNDFALFVTLLEVLTSVIVVFLVFVLSSFLLVAVTFAYAWHRGWHHENLSPEQIWERIAKEYDARKKDRDR